MTYPTFTKEMLSEFSGRPAVSYQSHTTQALSQAVLLFKIGTCLSDLPEDATMQQLASMGILAMADAIVLSQPYQKAAASPFSSESIGSYSYSKAAGAVSRGEKTGVMWFDLAIDKMSVCDINDDIPFSGGIEVFEHDVRLVAGAAGNRRMLSPQDVDQSRTFGFDPAPIN